MTEDPSGVALAALQDRIRQRYLAKDEARGIQGTFLWLVEEVGEVSMALREKRGDLAEELADVLAWTLSVANLADVDLAAAFEAKYPRSGCIKCGAEPCEC